LAQKHFHLHRDRRRSLSDRVMKITSFAKYGELPDREIFNFSKTNLLHGEFAILKKISEKVAS